MRSKTLLTEADKELKVFGTYLNPDNGRDAVIKTDNNAYYIYKYIDNLKSVYKIEGQYCMNIAIKSAEDWVNDVDSSGT